eukprot:gene31738-39206_t
MISLGVNQVNESIITNPTPGTYSANWQSTFFNASTAVVTFALYKEVDFIQWGDSDGFTFLYGQYNNGDGGLSPYAALAATSTNIATCTTWSCTTTQYSFTLNMDTGRPAPTTAFKTATNYPTSQRPWFWPATANDGVSYTTYYSAFSGANLVCLSQPYYQKYIRSGFTEYKVAANYVVLTYLSDKMAALNTDPLTTTGYVMTTINPVGLLMASTTGLAFNATTFATSSSNAVIKSTSEYILANNIQEDTSGYVASLGCYLSVQFFSAGEATPSVVSPPAGSSLPSSSTSGVNSATGIKWTVVSCTTEAAPTTTYSTNDDASSSTSAADKAILPLVVVIFVMVLLFFIAGVMHLLNQGKPALTQNGVVQSGTQLNPINSKA